MKMITPATAGLLRMKRRVYSVHLLSCLAGIRSAVVSGPTCGCMVGSIMSVLISAHPHSRVENHDGDVGEQRADGGQYRAEGGDGDHAVHVVSVDGGQEVAAHALPGEDRLGQDGTGEDRRDRKRHLRRHRDERGAQSMAADGLLL